MKEQVSALVDGELSEFETARLLRALEKDPELRDTWGRYHVIRSALRGEGVYPLSDVNALPEAGRADAPSHRGLSAIKALWQPVWRSAWARGAVAAAAGFAAVSVWVARDEVGPVVARAPVVAPASVAVTGAAAPNAALTKIEESPVRAPLEAYLLAHHEYGEPNGMGVVPQARVVSFDPGKP